MKKVLAHFCVLRPKHWIKNGFVILPLFFAEANLEQDMVLSAFGIAALFCLASSMVYVLNDWMDRASDRLHPKKKERPFASGALNNFDAVLLLATLASLLVFLALVLEISTTITFFLLIFVLVNVGYSLGLKKFAVIDIVCVASGYVIRVTSGTFGIQERPSLWLLFTIGSLALLIISGKRKAEIKTQKNAARLRSSLGAYSETNLDQLLKVFGFLVISFYFLFTVSAHSLAKYQSSILPWSSIFVAIGIYRFLAMQKDIRRLEDPVLLVLQDRSLLVSIFFWLIFITASIQF